MRIVLGLVVFVIAGPTLAGTALLALLVLPEFGYTQIDVMGNFGWVAGISFLVALPVSFVISGVLARNMRETPAKV